MEIARYRAFIAGRTGIGRYDEGIACTDREVGRLLDAHRRLGFADHAVSVFTSDHGGTLAEPERWFHHGHPVLEPLLRVPLVLHGPGVATGGDPR